MLPPLSKLNDFLDKPLTEVYSEDELYRILRGRSSESTFRLAISYIGDHGEVLWHTPFFYAVSTRQAYDPVSGRVHGRLFLLDLVDDDRDPRIYRAVPGKVVYVWNAGDVQGNGIKVTVKSGSCDPVSVRGLSAVSVRYDVDIEATRTSRALSLLYGIKDRGLLAP